MQLPADRAAEYIEIMWQDDPPAERARALAGLERALAAGRVSPADIRVIAAPDGRLAAAVRLVALRPGEHVLTEVGFPPGRPPADEDLAALVGEAMARASEIGVEVVSTRLGHLLLTAGYERALRGAGFREIGRRIEFETPLADLPLEGESPFEWRDLAAVGMPLAAETLARVSTGDPTGDPERDDPERALRAFLAEPGLTSGPGCIQIGYLAGRPAAFVMAQSDPPSGFGRITYMGLAPEARGRGLGPRVQLHGLTMMREQGAAVYRGGTAASDAPMLACFRALGCREEAHLVEFRWERPAD